MHIWIWLTSKTSYLALVLLGYYALPDPLGSLDYPIEAVPYLSIHGKKNGFSNHHHCSFPKTVSSLLKKIMSCPTHCFLNRYFCHGIFCHLHHLLPPCWAQMWITCILLGNECAVLATVYFWAYGVIEIDAPSVWLEKSKVCTLDLSNFM